MFDINIDVPRPWQTLALLGIATWAVISVLPPQKPAPADVVSPGPADSQETQPETSGATIREIIARKEGILRAQIDALNAELAETDDPEVAVAIADATARLKLLLEDKRGMEDALMAAYEQQIHAQNDAVSASQKFYYAKKPVQRRDGKLAQWPVEPKKGISAGYHDPTYPFGVHEGVDIPTPQGTQLHAVDDGVIIETSDNGFGFSSITLQTDDGLSVLYGHVSAILVESGDRVRAGDIIGKSGGRPGTKGAGLLTTGPHVHLEVIEDGTHKDPLPYLPGDYDLTTDRSRDADDHDHRVFYRNGEAL